MLAKSVRFVRCFYYGMIRNELFLRSAALTYYAIFSIFPITILISTIAGWILQDPIKQQAIVDALIGLMPQGTDLIIDLLQNVIRTRAITSIIALLTLLWSATSFLRGLLSAIDLIHSREYTHSTFVMRGVGVLIIFLAVLALFALLFLTSVATQIAQAFSIPPQWRSSLSILTSGLPIFLIASCAFFLMMRYIPGQRTPTRAALISAILTALAWMLLGYAFSWYLQSGLADFNVIYGSIGAVMALMLYLYLSNVIILFGAQLNASLADFETRATPYIPGLDDALRLLRLPLPETNDEEHPPNKPTIAP